MQPVTVLVVDGSRAVRAQLKEVLAAQPDLAVVGEAEDGPAAVRLARELRPQVVVMEVLLPGSDGWAAAAALRAAGAQVVVVSADQSPAGFRRAMQIGVRDYLPKPPPPDELVAAVRAAARQGEAEPGLLPSQRGRVVTVLSGRGGVGKTLLAVNLAVGLALRHGGRAAVVDLDLDYGGVEGVLQLKPRASLADLLLLSEPPDAERVQRALTPVPGFPLWVLAAPSEPLPAVDGLRIGELLAALAQAFPWVVVDTPPGLRDATVAALDRSDLVLLVATPDVAAALASARCLRLLCGPLGFPRERVRVVLNRRDAVAVLGAAEVAEALGMPVAWELPYDGRAASHAVSVGQPLCGRRSRSPLAAALGRMAAALADAWSRGEMP